MHFGVVGENRRVRMPARSRSPRSARTPCASGHPHAIPLAGGRFPEGNRLAKAPTFNQDLTLLITALFQTSTAPPLQLIAPLLLSVPPLMATGLVLLLTMDRTPVTELSKFDICPPNNW